MPHYPIILVPELVEFIMNTQPDVLPFPELPPKPKKPPAPKAPQREIPQAPKPLEGRFRNTGALAGIGILALTALAGPLELLIVGGAAAYAAYDATFGYEEREKKYHEEKSYYETVELPNWKHEMQEWERNKEYLIAVWEKECQQLEANWHAERERQIAEHNKRCQELLTSEEIAQWRSERLHHLIDSQVLSSEARHGRLDNSLLNTLKEYLPSLDIRWKEGLHIKNEKLYTPDVIVHDPQTHIWIDIEIDEPWYKHNNIRTPCHTLGSDDYRNKFFIDHGWIVIRFAETQVIRNPTACVKVVAEVLNKFRGDDSLICELKDTSELEPVEQWTEDTALNISR